MRWLIHALRSFWRVLWRSDQLDTEMQQEMDFHVDMEAERLARSGRMSPEEARRQARVHFSDLERYKEESREARGFSWLNGLSLDTRLGVRMLMKHRGLTLVGGFAMAVAIAIGAVTFEVIRDLLNPALPFPDGQRVVAVTYVTTNGEPDDRVLQPFATWRDRLQTLECVGAYRSESHNLVAEHGSPEPVEVAEISASAFAIAQTPAMLGRFLLASDEAAAAPAVVVIGHDAWRVRFNSDPRIVGHDIELGGAQHTIVGVMPAGFGFPFDHQFWIPLQLDPLRYPPWQGPAVHVFARLKGGATLEQAGLELASAGRAIAAFHPEGPENVHPVVLPFTRERGQLTDPMFVSWLRAAQILIGALALIVAVNLAVLLYARTVTRLGEIAVRTALGASRPRILSQLFVEALALTTLGALAGLGLAYFALQRIETVASGFPFWVHFQLSLGTALYALLLALVAALIMGVAPGLKATGMRLSSNLRELNGRTTTRLGSLWTALIVAQVAVASAVLPVAAYVSWHVVRTERTGSSIAIERFVIADMRASDEAANDQRYVRDRLIAFIERVREIPGVSAVTFSSAVPGLGPDRAIEVPETARDGRTRHVAVCRIDINLLKTYGARMLAGRDFARDDPGSSAVAIVNRTFASDVLGLAAPAAVGSRFRYAGDTTWFEVIGVVDDFPGFPRSPGSETEPTVYHSALPGDFNPAVVSMRFDGPIPEGIAMRLRQAAAQVDPSLQLQRVVPLKNFSDELHAVWRLVALAASIVTMGVLLLSAAGMHALLSFTVVQRTREIGIRSALGARPRVLLAGIIGRTMGQLSIGLLVGTLASAGILVTAGIGLRSAAAMLLAVMTVMTVVACLAAMRPARRSIRLPLVDALRVEG